MSEQTPNHTVLLVDDEPGIVRLCQRLLEREGFRVIGLTDPTQGLNLLVKQQIDLLLVDIRMPVMDGFELLARARQFRPELAVVVMTGYGTVETAVEALRRGANGLVLKPFPGRELVETVQSALRDSQQKQDALRLQALHPLFAVSETLLAETDLTRLQDLLLDTVCSSLETDRAGLYLMDPEQDCFQLLGWKGEPLEGVDLPMVVSLFKRTEHEKMPYSFGRDTVSDGELKTFLQAYHLQALLVCPIFSPKGNEVCLLLGMRNLGKSNYRQYELETFAIFARQAGIALENARLHSELRAYIRRVEDSQKALLQAEKMAIAGRMTASIAHEINNPLQAVQNCLHLAGRMQLPPDERENYRQMAQTELERLMHTVQQMLDYYRPGGLDRKPVNLNDILKRVLLLMDRQLIERKIKYQVQYDPQLPEVVVVRDQLQQVFLNLVINAMEAMTEGGELIIETAHGPEGVEIFVEDSGPGVPEELRKRIFEPFVSTKEGGTGLGLAVSYGILSAHGGSLDLVEEREKGACFRVRIPVGEPQ